MSNLLPIKIVHEYKRVIIIVNLVYKCLFVTDVNASAAHPFFRVKNFSSNILFLVSLNFTTKRSPYTVFSYSVVFVIEKRRTVWTKTFLSHAKNI